MADGPGPHSTPPGDGPSGRPLPLSVRLLGAGVRSARSVSKAAGIDRAVESAAEEAMVAAIESEAVNGPRGSSRPGRRGGDEQRPGERRRQAAP